jgi:hypothetical protein
MGVLGTLASAMKPPGLGMVAVPSVAERYLVDACNAEAGTYVSGK